MTSWRTAVVIGWSNKIRYPDWFTLFRTSHGYCLRERISIFFFLEVSTRLLNFSSCVYDMLLFYDKSNTIFHNSPTTTISFTGCQTTPEEEPVFIGKAEVVLLMWKRAFHVKARLSCESTLSHYLFMTQ